MTLKADWWHHVRQRAQRSCDRTVIILSAHGGHNLRHYLSADPASRQQMLLFNARQYEFSSNDFFIKSIGILGNGSQYTGVALNGPELINCGLVCHYEVARGLERHQSCLSVGCFTIKRLLFKSNQLEFLRDNTSCLFIRHLLQSLALQLNFRRGSEQFLEHALHDLQFLSLNFS